MGMEVSVFQVEIDFSGRHILIVFGEQGGQKVQGGSGIGEDGCDTGTMFDLAIDAL